MFNVYNEIKDELLNHITPYYKKLIDHEFGGFYGDVSFDLEINKKSDKSGLSLSRYLFAFSRLYNSGFDDDALIYAKHAYDMLMDCFYDQENGGIYFLSDYKGNIIVDLKHTYVQGFFIYGLSEFYKATQDQTVLNLALQTFHLIEEKMYDQDLKGYLEEFTCDFKLKESELTSEHGVTAYFTTNTHLHILEAYTSLYSVSKDGEVLNKLLSMITLFEKTIKKDCSYQVFFDKHFTSILDTVSYGHDIETTWLIDEITKVVKDKDYYQRHLLKVVDECKKYINEDHSQILEVVDKEINTNRIWWVQAEAMVGYLTAYMYTNDSTYYDIFLNTWNYIKKYIIDPRESGEWYWEVDEANTPIKRNITEIWKTPYHNMRACIEVLERLNALKK